MKISLITIFFVLLISCKGEKERGLFFNDSLYSAVQNYQKNNPIPEGNLYKLFIYQVTFSQQKDTLVSITVNPTGIVSKNSYGIYEDKIIKPTYVIDNNHIGNKFVIKYRKDNIESYILEGNPPNIDLIYPIYKYKIRKGNLILIDSLR